ELDRQGLHSFSALIARLAAHCDHPTVGSRARGTDFQDLALDMQDVPRPRGTRPVNLSAGPDNPADDRYPGLALQPHGDRRRMPAARHQAAEQSVLSRLTIEMEGLRVELVRKRFDLRFVNRMRSAGESLSGMKVFEIKAPV